MNTEARWRLALPIGAGIGLALLLTALLLLGRSPDLGLAARMQEALQLYELRDAQLSRDVLLARAGLLPNYDPLAADREAVREALGSLQSVAGSGSAGARAALAAPMQSLAQAHATRLAAVEHFKSGNALLRNSLLYFAYIGPTLRGTLQRQDLAAALGRLSYDVLSFMQSPDDTTSARILALLERVDALGRGSDDLASLVQHGQLLVRVLPQVDAALAAIQRAPIEARLQALATASMRHDQLVESRARTWRTGLYLTAIAILACLGWAWALLRARARALRAAAAALEDQRLRMVGTSRLAVLGMHLEGVAHDLRTPIQSLSSSAGQLLQVWPEVRAALDQLAQADPDFGPGGRPWPVTRALLGEIPTDLRVASGKLLGLARHLLDFGRPAPEAPVLFDLNASLADTLRLIGHAVRERTHAYAFLPADGLPPARGEPMALGLVVLNLLTNALESLPDPGRAVTVRTRADAPGWLAIEVEDEGCGIPPAVMARLYEPFFTTKQGRGGTGLGLGMSRATLEAMGGRLAIESEPGRGTRAIVLLPAGSTP